jgi:cytoskeletal protein RodZ
MIKKIGLLKNLLFVTILIMGSVLSAQALSNSILANNTDSLAEMNSITQGNNLLSNSDSETIYEDDSEPSTESDDEEEDELPSETTEDTSD